MISIKDIAKECNVSPTTVSRALNNSKEISEKTREYILKVCEDMGYRPNLVARSLILNKSKMIGLIIPDITNQYYAFLSKGVNTFLEKQDYGLILCNSNRNKDSEKRYIDFLLQSKVDGVIIIPINDSPKDYDILTKNKVPFVFVDNYINDMDVSFIGNDNYSGGRKIILHMINKGYRRIGAILGGKNSTASNERLKGYMDVLKQHDIEIDEKILINSNATFEDGIRLAKNLIDQKVDSIFCINDTVAMGVIKYCYNNNIEIPKDLGIAGYDDIEESAMLPIPLTTMHQKKFTLGLKAAEVLFDDINNGNVSKQKVILQPELVIRKSCGE